MHVSTDDKERKKDCSRSGKSKSPIGKNKVIPVCMHDATQIDDGKKKGVKELYRVTSKNQAEESEVVDSQLERRVPSTVEYKIMQTYALVFGGNMPCSVSDANKKKMLVIKWAYRIIILVLFHIPGLAPMVNSCWLMVHGPAMKDSHDHSKLSAMGQISVANSSIFVIFVLFQTIFFW